MFRFYNFYIFISYKHLFYIFFNYIIIHFDKLCIIGNTGTENFYLFNV